ncbi:MAG: hypothetical protein V1726_02760 [Methanobacteriota archaeon]
MKKEQFSPEQSSCMFLKDKKTFNSDEQLALFIHRFNLDWETVEVMPAFEEHLKALFSRNVKK